MIPIALLAKMGIYEIALQGIRIKTTVLERASLVDACIPQLRSSIAPFPSRPVVGLDLKCKGDVHSDHKLLFLCSGTQCLIIHLSYFNDVPLTLKQFLEDANICFVGVGIGGKVGQLLQNFELTCKTGVELGELAARVLKKPSLLKSGLSDLLKESGLNNTEIPPQSGPSGSDAGTGTDWSAKVFTHEQVKFAMQDAFASYVLGTKLLGMV